MNIVIYLGHPAQYHFFKNAIKIWQSNGAKVKLLIKTKDILEDLLKEDKVAYLNIETFVRKHGFSFIFTFIRRIFIITKEARVFKADIFIGTEPSLAYAAKLLGKPCITVGEDDYPVVKQMLDVSGLATKYFLSPRVCNLAKWEKKKIPFDGYMKLAYLHPNRFTPNDKLVDELLGKEDFCFIRLVSLTAFHDVDINGISCDLLDRIIETIQKKGLRIYISSEKPLQPKYESYRITTPKTLIHSVLNKAKLVLCDSQSMAVEAAILGTPSIRISSFAGKISVLEELEHSYQLTFGFEPSKQEEILAKLSAILESENLDQVFESRKNQMLSEKIDVTAFLVWLISSYPASVVELKADTKAQLRFQ